MEECHRILGVSEDSTPEEIHKAYKQLARKWHPDRFAEGPERIWAEQKMIEINCAYNACISRCAPIVPEQENSKYGDVKLLIEAGQLSRARKLLRAMSDRDAEWNYYFGKMLYELHDYEKAVLFFRIAARQNPGNSVYALALANTETMLMKPRQKLLNKIHGIFNKKNAEEK